MIFANILHVHFDQTYWENPEEFNPQLVYTVANTQKVINKLMKKVIV